MKIFNKIMNIIFAIILMLNTIIIMGIGMIALDEVTEPLDGSRNFWIITISVSIAATSMFGNFLFFIGIDKIKKIK